MNKNKEEPEDGHTHQPDGVPDRRTTTGTPCRMDWEGGVRTRRFSFELSSGREADLMGEGLTLLFHLAGVGWARVEL